VTEAELRALIRGELSDAGFRSRSMTIPGRGDVGESLGDQVTNSPAFKAFVEKRQRASDDILITIPGLSIAPGERTAPRIAAKTLVSVDYATPIMTRRDLEIAERRTRVRDVIPVLGITAPTVMYTQVTGLSNNAAPVAEGGSKPQSNIVSEPVTVKVGKVATFLEVTREALDDIPAFRQFLDRVLGSFLLDAEDNELINGTGPPGLRGLENITGRTANVSFDTDVLKTIRKGITALQLANFSPSALLMHPNDWQAAELLRDSSGRFMLFPADRTPREAGTPTSLWGVPVAVSPAVQQGTAWLGDFQRAALYQYQQAVVRFTEAHSDFFIKNKLVVVAEFREVMAFFQPQALAKVLLA
jgi:HK97 family phage major capsid protein